MDVVSSVLTLGEVEMFDIDSYYADQYHYDDDAWDFEEEERLAEEEYVAWFDSLYGEL